MKDLKVLVDHYTYRTEWSEEDKTHIGRCFEFPSLAAHGDTTENALAEIKTVVLASVKWMNEDGEELPKPLGEKKYSGNFPLRMGPDVHRELAMKAEELHMSLNQLILTKICK